MNADATSEYSNIVSIFIIRRLFFRVMLGLLLISLFSINGAKVEAIPFGGGISVKKFGAAGDGVRDDTKAIQSALNAGAGIVFFPEGDYLISSKLNCSGSISGAGIGRSRLIFDQSQGSINGLYFTWDQEGEQLGLEGFSILCKNGNGLSAISCQKSAYFTGPNKLKVRSVSIADFDGPLKTVAGFLTTFTWSTFLDSGDVQGLEVTDFFAYSNYDITKSDDSNDTSVGVRLDGTQTQLFARLDGIWINACRIGISLEDKSFGFINNADVTRAWIGFDASTGLNFNEFFMNNVAVNAQKCGFNIEGFSRFYLSNSFANRHKDGLDQGHVWYGYNLNSVAKSFISNAHAQPNLETAAQQIGFRVALGGDLVLSSLIAGGNLDIGVQLENSSNISGNIVHANTSGVILDLLNNARVVNLSLGASESFTGTWYQDDGSLDYGNVEINVVDSSEYSTSGSTKFFDRIAIWDKNNSVGTGEGFSFVSEDGGLRIKSVSSGSETNVILLNRTSGNIDSIDFRTDKLQLNSSSTWHSGVGSPEGFVFANVGSFYSRTDGSPGTSFYVKESGVGNTGWVAK
jgi:hypothetical protein